MKKVAKRKRVRIFGDLGNALKKGSFPTRLSFLIMGFGNLARGQTLKGFLDRKSVV